MLTGKTVLITGASRGIGLAFAKTLAGAGADVILLARASAELDTACAEIGEAATALPCDVSDADALYTAFRLIARRFGKLDVLINNAAICKPYLIERSSKTDILAEITTNLIGPILCTREAIPLLSASGGGDIVNISSESVRLPFPYLTVYTATKGGLESFSAGLRAELRPSGIRVTTLRLGNVGDTGITRDWAGENAAALAEALQLSGHAAFTGKSGSTTTVSQALLSLLCLPRDFNTDLMELRAL